MNNYNLKCLIDKKNNFKRPPQFQNMSNEFEVAQWVAHHQKILNLAINISNGMATSIPADKEETETSSVILHPFSYSSIGSTLSEISQVILILN